MEYDSFYKYRNANIKRKRKKTHMDTSVVTAKLVWSGWTDTSAAVASFVVELSAAS